MAVAGNVYGRLSDASAFVGYANLSHRLQYTTDTMPGSSGSPVFNDEWHVVAIHHAGGDLVKNSQGDKVFANEGMLFKWILEDQSFHGVFVTR